MVKYRTSGLIQGVRGSVGDSTFYYWKGIPVVKKRVSKGNTPNTPSQEKVKSVFRKISPQWRKLSFKEWILWEEYAKKYVKLNSKKNGLIETIGGKMSGYNAFMSVNQLLLVCGFGAIQKPVLGKIGKPSLPKTDLVDFGLYEKKIKFNVWLSSPYQVKCVAQVWIKKFGKGYHHQYIRTTVPVSTSPNQVIIDKIRVKEENKLVEKKLSELEDCRLLIQLRTVAANGEFSIPSAIYRIEMKE